MSKKIKIRIKKPWAAYPGSTIPQNYSETEGKGFLLWDIAKHDDYDVSYVELPSKPFVTLDWDGSVDSVTSVAKSYPDGSKFRIRSNSQITQLEIKQLHEALKVGKKATEVVYKIDHVIDTSMVDVNGFVMAKDDLQSPAGHLRLLHEFVGVENDYNWKEIERIVTKSLVHAKCVDTCDRNTNWSLKRLDFDNIFAYGKGNTIDFTQLQGITGIFAPNKSGKSSIVGALMYCLYNATDRGSLKNVDVINSQKGHCRVVAQFTVNGKEHLIDRQSVKHENKKKGEVYASTSVNFAQIDSVGSPANVVVAADLNGEHRADTDSQIRKIIGSADDFMLTSLAAQSGKIRMDRFVSEGSTARREIISRFMGIDIFDRMLDAVKSEYDEINTQILQVPVCNWDTELQELDEKCCEIKDMIAACEQSLQGYRTDLKNVEIELSKLEDTGFTTHDDVTSIEAKVTAVDEKMAQLLDEISYSRTLISKIDEDIAKDLAALSEIDMASLLALKESARKLEIDAINARHETAKEEASLLTMSKSAEKLKVVPCGDQFPTCKFIRDSHIDKSKLGAQQKRIEKIEKHAAEVALALEKLNVEFIDAQLAKKSSLDAAIAAANTQLSNARLSISKNDGNVKLLSQKKKHLLAELADAKSRLQSDAVNDKLVELRIRRDDLLSLIADADATRLEYAQTKGRLESEIDKKDNDRIRYDSLKTKWRMYSMLNDAWSKRGIQAKIIKSQIAGINAEINKILHGVVDFTLELEASTDTNALEIYIVDAVSCRPFELASGMEKMIGSLALRVALTNVSSMPKSDMLIIDEGFGALDEMYIEAIGKFFTTLKKWFRNIILITHVDSLKDVVDNVLEINKDNDEKCAKVVFP